MKTLAKSIPIELFDTHYKCDLLLGLYADSTRPALILLDTDQASPDVGQTVAIATLNPPLGFLTGYPAEAFVFKTYSENEGLFEQLKDLRGSDGVWIFRPVLRGGVPQKITLSFSTCPIWTLYGAASLAFREELESFHASRCPKWNGVLDER